MGFDEVAYFVGLEQQDEHAARKVLQGSAQGHPPEPMVRLASLGASSIDFTVLWTVTAEPFSWSAMVESSPGRPRKWSPWR